MSKPKDESTQKPNRVTLRIDEIHSLADRLFSRGVTKLTNETAEQQRDLLTASRALRELARHFNSHDTIVIDANGA
jgi:hypothetical protein